MFLSVLLALFLCAHQRFVLSSPPVSFVRLSYRYPPLTVRTFATTTRVGLIINVIVNQWNGLGGTK